MIVLLLSLELSSSFFEINIQDINPKEMLNVGNQKSSVLIVEIGCSQNIVTILIKSTNHSSSFSFRTNLYNREINIKKIIWLKFI